MLRGSSALVPHFVDQFERLCSGNKYVTSLHACNSAVVKLGKLTSAATVYRGVSGLLPDAFWTPNRWGVCGGVENGFMSTTLDREVAMAYASSGAASTVYEIRMGSECRLAPFEIKMPKPACAWLTWRPFASVHTQWSTAARSCPGSVSTPVRKRSSSHH